MISPQRDFVDSFFRLTRPHSLLLRDSCDDDDDDDDDDDNGEVVGSCHHGQTMT